MLANRTKITSAAWTGKQGSSGRGTGNLSCTVISWSGLGCSGMGGRWGVPCAHLGEHAIITAHHVAQWICDPNRLLNPQSPFSHGGGIQCLVYSFGSRNDFGFENAILARFPKCEVSEVHLLTLIIIVTVNQCVMLLIQSLTSQGAGTHRHSCIHAWPQPPFQPCAHACSAALPCLLLHNGHASHPPQPITLHAGAHF